MKSGDGLLRLEVMGEQTFRSRIERHGKVVAYRAGSHGEELIKADARCSLDTATAWLASDAKDICRQLLPCMAARSSQRPKTESKFSGKATTEFVAGVL